MIINNHNQYTSNQFADPVAIWKENLLYRAYYRMGQIDATEELKERYEKLLILGREIPFIKKDPDYHRMLQEVK